MQHDVDVSVTQDAPDSPVTVSVDYGVAACKFAVAGPQVLARWLAYLFENRDRPGPDDPDQIELGRCGRNRVTFQLISDGMFLFVTPKFGEVDLGDGAILFIPRERLDDLADGLAREHRRWAEQAAQSST